ncbi:MAG: septum formation initiator family protein [Nitrospirales bacterium]|jgi:cell division protein FtsB
MRPNNKKRGSTGFWGDLFERLPFVGAFLVMSVLAGTMFFNSDGLPLYFQMRETRQYLAEQIKQLEAINAAVQEDITRIQRDPQRLEELARNRLGMVRQGEVVYQFVEPAPSSITARP